ncbi:hypothetical protein BDV93DRAFT_239036 [Ceratobasidium sp. AG-I]|nr:hypothetical protein BDV93DRAFT_239036 [Ceratobasidium sp. AG-I]
MSHNSLVSSQNAMFEPRLDNENKFLSFAATPTPAAQANAANSIISTSPTPAISAGPQLRKRKATSAAGPPEPLFAARRKDIHARLGNLLKTIDAAAKPPPTLVPPTSRPSNLKSAAADVWYYMQGASSSEEPADLNKILTVDRDIEYQDSKPFRQFKRPTGYEFLHCISCL